MRNAFFRSNERMAANDCKSRGLVSTSLMGRTTQISPTWSVGLNWSVRSNASTSVDIVARPNLKHCGMSRVITRKTVSNQIRAGIFQSNSSEFSPWTVHWTRVCAWLWNCKSNLMQKSKGIALMMRDAKIAQSAPIGPKIVSDPTSPRTSLGSVA